MASVTVVSLGGSLIAPDGVDADFLRGFVACCVRHLKGGSGRALVVVCGGGPLARRYQAACRAVAPSAADSDLDWIGIAATRLNAELLRRAFGSWCQQEVVSDPTAVDGLAGRLLVASGWKPGFSSDQDAVLLAQRLGAATVVNLTNVPRVYTADPRTDPSARPLDRVSWAEFRAIVGEEWVPGKNTPFDPVAAGSAARARLRVVIADGRDLANLSRILEGGPFTGTTIGPA